jgi:hypothetical protein
MTGSYPVGDACGDAVACGAMLGARTASWRTAREAVSRAPKPGNLAGTDSSVGSS